MVKKLKNQKKSTKTYAVYVRANTPAALLEQVTDLLVYARNNSIHVPSVCMYGDIVHGLDHMPNFERMLNEVREYECNGVLISHFNRLGRTPERVASNYQRLLFHNLVVVQAG